MGVGVAGWWSSTDVRCAPRAPRKRRCEARAAPATRRDVPLGSAEAGGELLGVLNVTEPSPAGLFKSKTVTSARASEAIAHHGERPHHEARQAGVATTALALRTVLDTCGKVDDAPQRVVWRASVASSWVGPPKRPPWPLPHVHDVGMTLVDRKSGGAGAVTPEQRAHVRHHMSSRSGARHLETMGAEGLDRSKRCTRARDRDVPSRMVDGTGTRAVFTAHTHRRAC